MRKIFLSISLNICFGCSKEPSHWDGSFEYPQHMLWMGNGFFFLLHTYFKAWQISTKLCSLTTLTLFILDTHKQALCLAVKTQMKCCLIRLLNETHYNLEISTHDYPILIASKCICLFDLILYIPVNSFSVMSVQVFLEAGINVSCSRTQCSAPGEVQTRNHSISSQALYQWAPIKMYGKAHQSENENGLILTQETQSFLRPEFFY